MSTITPTRQESKVCGQTIASLAALGITIHVVNEAFTEFRDLPAFQIVIVSLVFLTTLAVTAAWYRMRPVLRRVLAVVLGLLWTLAASEHLFHLLGNGPSVIDLTGVLAFLAGPTLLFAAYWDHHRPMDGAR